VTCQGTVPEAIVAFLESTDYESAVRLGVSLGGDSDTLGAIAGGFAQAYYSTVPAGIVAEVRGKLPQEFLDVVDEFETRFGVGRRS
jgi:ADP-ribosyl-[dinitrogen reductase] hydrolase